ncbi:MAG TPA: amidohydrolase family protein [Pirellulales bacterium]|jgi:N-acetylglucosamine-6-phosphate deacetylase
MPENRWDLLARRYDTGEIVRVAMAGTRIESVQSPGVPLSGSTSASTLSQAVDNAEESSLPWVSPGFVDIQINGYGGQEFSSLDLTPQRVADIVRQHFAFGVTRVCPTLTTQSLAVLSHGVTTIRAACEKYPDVNQAVAGVHLEGPYFSTEDGPRGAHPAEHCRRPSWPEFVALQEASGGRVRLLTMSPEFDEAPAFIARVVSSGVTVAIGHTGASGRQIRAAVDAGARLSTHLGNGAHRMLRRHPNYLWDQLAEDRLWASLIVDGHHLPPEVVKTFLRAKTTARCLLVSDVSGLAGLSPGRYTSSGCELEILADGRLVIAGQDQLLAGASAPIGVGIANVMRFAGLDVTEAVGMATHAPATLLSIAASRLEAGSAADLVLFDLPADLNNVRDCAETGQAAPDPARAEAPNTNEGLTIRTTILAGQIVYQK